MKAILMHNTGNSDVLKLGDAADPIAPRNNQLLVQIRAAGVNPVDAKLRSNGTYFPENVPVILGCDGAGVVEATGPDASRFKTGDGIYFCHGGIGDAPGNYAEYGTIDEDSAALAPRNLTMEEAAAAPLVLITAWEALHDRVGIKAGQKILIHAGAGGVGHVAIQIAKAAGAKVMTTVSDKAKAKFVTELGADKVVNYKKDDFVKAALEWTDGKGVDVVFDTVGGTTFTQSIAATRHYGDLVSILEPPLSTEWRAVRLRNLRISLELVLTPMISNLPEARRHQSEILEKCTALIESGKLKIHVSKIFPLTDAAKAHRLIESGGTTGKMVLRV